jgi:hypothetical protein
MLRRELTEECCGKRRFATRQVAETEITRLAMSGHEKLPASSYQCAGGWWHLTAQPREVQLARAAARARERGALQRTAGLQPVSPKRAAANRQRRAMVNELYPEQPLCSVYESAAGDTPVVVIPAVVLDACRWFADDLHEPLTRARGGSITDEDNQTPLCRSCHDVITFRPESELGWAYDLGLLAHSSRPSKAVPRRRAA